jgi:peptidoglycan/xylan/chitin deacetylase (PgdA/CDA1 family)
MRPELFEEIIRYLKKNFSVVMLEEYLEHPEQFKGNRQIATVLFDDGYKDNIEFAAPILKKHQCPASFYVATDCIDRNIPTWTYIMDHLFQQTNASELSLPFDWIPVEKRENRFATAEERVGCGAWLKPFMKKMPDRQRVAVVNAVQSAFSDVMIPRDKMMSWKEVAQLKSDGFVIGSHSVTHPLLATIEDPEALKTELAASAETIVKQLGHFPKTISYPIGSYDDKVIKCSREVGYQYGLAVDQRFYDRDADPVMAIPRVELYNESMLKTRLRISGAMQVIKSLIR